MYVRVYGVSRGYVCGGGGGGGGGEAQGIHGMSRKKSEEF